MNSIFRRMTLALSVLSLLAFPGCGSEENGPNQPPVAYLTTGPLEGSEVHYRITVSWTATDPDGSIDHYEYAVDPPAEFTGTEIAQGGPDVTSQIIPGEDEDPTVTRVSKVEGGQTVFFDWVHTRAKKKLFTFSATEPDSAGEDTLRAPTGRFTDMHALYVRAVDNDNAVSMPDKVAFTATTLAPSSELIKPKLHDGFHNLGANITMVWAGEDPDGSSSPTKFLYKLVRLDALVPPVRLSSFDDPEAMYEIEGDWVDWESLEQTFDLAPGQYVFALRAVDEAGAEEPFIEWGRNAFRFQAWLGYRPELTIVERSMGPLYTRIFVFRGTNPAPENVDVPIGFPLKFSWSASAESYAGSIWAYSWGIDVADVDADGPDAGWSPWGSSLKRPGFPIIFESGGPHVLYVRARDNAGGTTLGSVRINSIDFPFDREVLYVDDSFDNLNPRDSEHDAFWRTRLENYGKIPEGKISEFHAHLDNDRGLLDPQVPLLSDLSRYRLVIWENRGFGYNGRSALLTAAGLDPILANYLRAGGKLWLGGSIMVAATMPISSGLNADFVYPKELAPGQFVWDFLKLRGTMVINDKGSDTKGKNNLAKVRPYPGQAVIYPEMVVDPDKLFVAAQLRGVSHAEALCDPELDPEDPNFRGIIEPLYLYGSTGQDLLDPPRESTFHDKLTALRWHDPDPDRELGRVQWFGFPLYFFEDFQAQETFNRSLDWFREESPSQ